MSKLICDRYELKRELGSGAMGCVYLARDVELDRLVALKKVLAGNFQDEATSNRRLLREARNCARLDHENIIKIYDAFQDEDLVWIVMEYVDGKTLRQLLLEGIEVQRALDFMEPVCRSLSYAQQRGVVHRDLKPDNIFVSRDGVVKVGDWGLSRSIEDDSGLTKTGMIVGTPEYLAPERILGKAVEPASDLYALGCTIYEIVSGHTPFGKLAIVDLLRAHLDLEPNQLNTRDVRLNKIVIRTMRKDPSKRPSLEEIIDVLKISRTVKVTSVTAEAADLNDDVPTAVTITTEPLEFSRRTSKSFTYLTCLCVFLFLSLLSFNQLTKRNTQNEQKLFHQEQSLVRSAYESTSSDDFIEICQKIGELRRDSNPLMAGITRVVQYEHKRSLTSPIEFKRCLFVNRMAVLSDGDDLSDELHLAILRRLGHYTVVNSIPYELVSFYRVRLSKVNDKYWSSMALSMVRVLLNLSRLQKSPVLKVEEKPDDYLFEAFELTKTIVKRAKQNGHFDFQSDSDKSSFHYYMRYVCDEIDLPATKDWAFSIANDYVGLGNKLGINESFWFTEFGAILLSEERDSKMCSPRYITKAIELCEKSLSAARSKYDEALCHQLLCRANDAACSYDKALEQIEIALSKEDRPHKVYQMLEQKAFVLQNLLRFKEALATWQKAWEVCPELDKQASYLRNRIAWVKLRAAWQK